MHKNAETIGTIYTQLQYYKKIKTLTLCGKNILVIVMFLLLCLFSGTVQARGDIPDNLIEEKGNIINDVILSASEGLTLTSQYTAGTESIKLNWNVVSGTDKYTVYQSKSGEEAKYLTTVYSNSITLNRGNAGIKDENGPTMPTVTATQTADGLGNNIKVSASTDKGTTYEHYIEAATAADGGYLVFMVDYGKGNSGWVNNAKTAMKEIGRELISKNIKIGIVVNGGDSATASWDFTGNISTFESNIDSMYRITHGSMAERNACCKKYVKQYRVKK